MSEAGLYLKQADEYIPVRRVVGRLLVIPNSASPTGESSLDALTLEVMGFKLYKKAPPILLPEEEGAVIRLKNSYDRLVERLYGQYFVEGDSIEGDDLINEIRQYGAERYYPEGYVLGILDEIKRSLYALLSNENIRFVLDEHYNKLEKEGFSYVKPRER